MKQSDFEQVNVNIFLIKKIVVSLWLSRKPRGLEK